MIVSWLENGVSSMIHKAKSRSTYGNFKIELSVITDQKQEANIRHIYLFSRFKEVKMFTLRGNNKRNTLLRVLEKSAFWSLRGSEKVNAFFLEMVTQHLESLISQRSWPWPWIPARRSRIPARRPRIPARRSRIPARRPRISWFRWSRSWPAD